MGSELQLTTQPFKMFCLGNGAEREPGLEISTGNSEQHQREKAKPQISMGLSQDKQLPECVEHLHTQSEKRKAGKVTRWNKSFESRCSSHTGRCGLFQGNEHLQSPSSPADASLDRCC